MPFCTQTGKLITITLPGGQPCPPGTYSFIVMRIVVLLAALLASQILSAQSTDSVRHGPSLSLQLGFRVHDNSQEYANAGGEPMMLSSPMAGLMLQMPRMPLRVGAQVDFNVLLLTPIINRQPVNYPASSVAETWIEYQLQAYYDFSKWTLGLGTYWKWRENSLNHDLPGAFVREYFGVQLSAGIPLNWLDLEFRTKVGLKPGFAVRWGFTALPAVDLQPEQEQAQAGRLQVNNREWIDRGKVLFYPKHRTTGWRVLVPSRHLRSCRHGGHPQQKRPVAECRARLVAGHQWG
jgi:hypothetical protein